MTNHKAAIPKGTDFRTSHLICNNDPSNFRFGKEGHAYGKLVKEESFTDQLGMNEYIVGIHGYLIETGVHIHVIAFNFIVAEVILPEQDSLLQPIPEEEA